jgi:hypothetical protein
MQADVVVYGATSAGVCAAVAAAENGASVILVEPGAHVGGMTSGGLGYTDVGDVRVVGGMAARFRQAVADWYGVPNGRYSGPEPHVAEAIFVDWLARARVTTVFHARLAGVELRDRRVVSLRLGSGSAVAGGVFIDASYEGDLLSFAGVPTSVGRESTHLHGERFAGRQEVVPGHHAMPPWISPFRDDPDGFEEGLVLPQLSHRPLAPVGSGDGGVMAYGYRVCLTKAADRIPFERPAGYDEEYWELGRRLFAKWRREGRAPSAGQLIGLEENLPGAKCDGNSLGPLSLNVLDGTAWEYPEATPSRREQIRQHHLDHTSGFLYFLSHDASVPASIRNELSAWGLPPDEFADTGHLPHQLYIREARRMVGEYTLTEHDLLDSTSHEDAVGMGSYHIDIREVQRGWRWVYEHPRPIAMVVTEGYLSVPVKPYQIPYRSLLPRRRDCVNVLAAVCISASHVAFSSVRMEVQYQMLGQAAGIAAAQSVLGGQAVHDIPIAGLQDSLRSGGQILAL